MTLLFEIEQGHSAQAVMIANVVNYIPMDDNERFYLVTYKDKGELWDVCIGHVKSIKEVKL